MKINHLSEKIICDQTAHCACNIKKTPHMTNGHFINSKEFQGNKKWLGCSYFKFVYQRDHTPPFPLGHRIHHF